MAFHIILILSVYPLCDGDYKISAYDKEILEYLDDIEKDSGSLIYLNQHWEINMKVEVKKENE